MEQEQAPTFGQYGRTFQEKIFRALITDSQWASQMCEVIDTDYFELKYVQYLSEQYFSFYEKYKVFPQWDTLLTIVKDNLSAQSDTAVRSQVVDFLSRLREGADNSDLAYVKEKSLDFCRQQAFKAALEESLELIATEKFDSVVDVMKNAMLAGTAASAGHEFFEDYETRFIETERSPIETGLSVLDAKGILNGGLGKGELGVVVGNTGTGKSHALVSFGAAALALGKNVVHYTMELSEGAVGRRYDSHLCEINSDEIVFRKDEVIKHYTSDEAQSYGRLFIKEYPTSTATVNTLKAHLNRLTLKGFTPDVVMIDYADIMRSTRRFDSLRHELKLVYEQLRNLAMEQKLPIWTASQANRSSANSDIVGLENMSEAYGKAMVADVIVSISRKPEEKALGTGRMFIAKNRAGRDGLVFDLKIDTARSKFDATGDGIKSLMDAQSSEQRDIKETLRRRLNEVKRDKSLNITQRKSG